MYFVIVIVLVKPEDPTIAIGRVVTRLVSELQLSCHVHVFPNVFITQLLSHLQVEHRNSCNWWSGNVAIGSIVNRLVLQFAIAV